MASASPAAKKTSTLGIVALILSIVGLVIGLVPLVGFLIGMPLGLAGVLFGLAALLTGGSTTRKGLPIAGTVVGVLALVASYYSLHLLIGLGLATRQAVQQSASRDPVAEKRQQAKAAPTVTVTELLRAYNENPEKANSTYRGGWLQIKGTVSNTWTSGTPAPWTGLFHVALGSEEKDVPGAVEVAISTAPFPFATQEWQTTHDDFVKLTKGQEVTIGARLGEWNGRTLELGDVVLLE